MRILLDANVLVSAVISPRGAPARILDLWKIEVYELIISPSILDELGRVLKYPKIQAKYKLPIGYVSRFLHLVQKKAIVIEPTIKISAILKDETDNRYLECAVAGEASYIISGDKHLLELKEYQGIVILAPGVFLTLFDTGMLSGSLAK